MPAGIKVQGARTLRRTLKQAGLGVADLKAGHKAAAEVVKTKAEPWTPQRSGRLRASIKAGAFEGTARVTAGGTKAVPYANPIHWGWKSRNITAQPWLYAAAKQSEPQWLDAYLKAVEAVIEKVEGAPGP